LLEKYKIIKPSEYSLAIELRLNKEEKEDTEDEEPPETPPPEAKKGKK
jgi:hypothetical protein